MSGSEILYCVVGEALHRHERDLEEIYHKVEKGKTPTETPTGARYGVLTTWDVAEGRGVTVVTYRSGVRTGGPRICKRIDRDQEFYFRPQKKGGRVPRSQVEVKESNLF